MDNLPPPEKITWDYLKRLRGKARHLTNKYIDRIPDANLKKAADTQSAGGIITTWWASPISKRKEGEQFSLKKLNEMKKEQLQLGMKRTNKFWVHAQKVITKNDPQPKRKEVRVNGLPSKRKKVRVNGLPSTRKKVRVNDPPSTGSCPPEPYKSQL